MRLAAVYIPKNTLPHIFGENHEELTINLGEEITEDFWGENISMVSAIVGKNGSGKSSLLKYIRENYTTKRFDSNSDIVYYSPHLDYNDLYDFDIDINNISLDSILRRDLENIIDDEKEDSESGWRLNPKQDLEHLNTARQVDFLSSKLRIQNPIFADIFEGLKFEIGSLLLRGSNKREYTRDSFHNTPYQFRGPILDILKKTEVEISSWIKVRKMESEKVVNQHEINAYIFKRNIIKSFLSVVIDFMEKRNTYLEEGLINEIDVNEKSAIELLFHFINNAKVYGSGRDKSSAKIVFTPKVIELFEMIFDLVDYINDEDSISTKSFKLNYNNLERLMLLQKEIISYLSKNYYYQKSKVSEFLAFKSTDRKLSSGENALLNFYSVLYEFVQQIDEDEIYDDYILLLDEADLGYHPEWKKRFVDSIVKSLPAFFKFSSKQSKIQIIFSTHDPLTLSDIPRKNIVFLDKDNNGLTIISHHNKETFGANIHDLLSDSFFVEDGLIGEFARGKIHDVIEYINYKEKRVKKKWITSPEVAKKVIDQIGEPYLSDKLNDMFLEAFPQFKKDEIKRLEEKLKQLRNDSNSSK